MLKIGIIGTGGMANHHATSLKEMDGVRLAACCDVRQDSAQAFAAKYGIPGVYTDYRQMLATEKLDGVLNVTPDAVHCEVALAVLEAGVGILSEKPMATTLDDARRMLAAAEKAGVVNMINFSYRNSTALQHAARVVQDGGIGRVIHIESSYLQSWLVATSWGDWREKPGLTWRLSTGHGSGGVLGDLGCHIYDLTALLCGEIAEIDCRLKTFDKGIPGNKLGEYLLDANDSFASTITLKNGAVGVVHSSRWAVGHANSLRARVYGDKGGIEIDLDRAYDEYRICAGQAAIDEFKWETVKCEPTPSNHARFLTALRTGKNDASDFANGVRVQAYLDASFRSAEENGPVAVAG